MRNVLLVLMSFTLVACFGFKPFQPSPTAFKRWHKQGVSEGGVKQTMLECGFNNLYNNGRMEDNSYAEAQNCMLQKGFTHSSGFNICSLKSSQNLPACQKYRESHKR